MKNLFEIYLTSEYVESKEWMKLFLRIGKINGRFRRWNLWIVFDKSYVRYFVETRRLIPPVLGELGSFLFKKSDMKLKEKSVLSVPFFLTSNYKNVLDVLDSCESKKMQKMKKVKISFFTHKVNNYFSKTKMYMKTKDEKIVRRKVFFNFSVFEFVSIDFGIHTRFFYSKEVSRYLETKKTINLLNDDKEKALIKADVFPYFQEELYLRHKDFDFDKHSVVIGASGTGKSKLISSLIKQLSNDNQNKMNYKVVVIDPHSSMEDDIGGLDGARVIDFKSEEDSINLFVNGTEDILSSTESIMAIFKNIIADRYNSRLERVLRYSIHLLLVKGEFNLITLRKLLIEIEYRNRVLKDVQDDVPINIIEFFRVDFNELKNKSYQESIAPIISFIDEMQLLPAFGNVNETTTIKEEIEKNFVTILSLDQMTLGLNITKSIAGFCMQSILQLVQSHTFGEHVILVIDEVSVIENPIINRFLSEARKYNLSLILAGQYFEQISNGLQKAIFTNVVNYFIFRVSRMDAIILENNIKMEVAVKNSHINRMKILTELEDRECVIRVGKNGRLYSAIKGKTADFIPVSRKRKSKRKILKKNEPEFKKPFSTETTNTLKEIMLKQSASRKKINFGEN